MMVRTIKILMVAIIALFFTLVAFGNMTDYQANWPFVMHVLSMDTTFKDPAIMWRAVNNHLLQYIAYYAIIVWETLTALMLWLGTWMLYKGRKNINFNKTKKIALLGLFMGFVLYMLGFIAIGGEWFAMWQSTIWNGEAKAGMFLNFILLTMIFIAIKDKDEWV
jgi:predicted small integral membrane protein